VTARRPAPLPHAIHSGDSEGAFARLPETVIANLRRPNSENARLWNTFNPRPGRPLALRPLLATPRLWGTAMPEAPDDRLEPYFWGCHPGGERLEGLDLALAAVDGVGPQTEIDLILRGAGHLVVVEAKNLSTLGRCGRYQRRACPEVHRSAERWLEGCRYWEVEAARFEAHLDFGRRPGPGTPRPPCAAHYQLARTLLVGLALSAPLGLQLHLWLLLPQARWPALERTWLNFAGRVRDPDLWRRLRVLAWDDVAIP
jgi:Holliday junction resolvase-like predicted endonuclease